MDCPTTQAYIWLYICWNTLNQGYQYEDITDSCNKWLGPIEELVSGEPRMYVDRTREILKNDAEEIARQIDQLGKNTMDEESPVEQTI